MAAHAPPDYYRTLEIPSTASTADIRSAYKKQALKHHPDRVPADSAERAARTRRFQQINDAYYTLSDARRRREYDDSRRAYGGFDRPSAGTRSRTGAAPPGSFEEFEDDSFDADEEIPAGGGSGGGGAFSGFPWSFFGSGAGQQPRTAQTEEQFSSQQFGSVFEEMLREEGMAEGQDARPTGKFWGIIGGLSGGAMGFILANFPGAVAGAVAGNRLGAVRDAKGKSVYAVFQELPRDDRARLLSEMAAKVFAHAVGS